MESPSAFVEWYAVATIGLVLFSAGALLLRYVIFCAISALGCFFIRHFIYCRIRILPWSGIRTAPIAIIGAVAVILANAACASWNVRSAEQLSLRCASLLATNLILLLPGMDPTKDCLRISGATYQTYHTVFATTAIVEGIVHTAIELHNPRWLDVKILASGVVGVSTLGLILTTSVLHVRRRFFELFKAAHALGSVTMCVALWLHTPTLPRIARTQAIFSSCIWVSNVLYRACHILYRNCVWGKACTHIMVERIRNALSVEVTLPRTWNVKPGQYVYLTMRRPGIRSVFQRHPFLVFRSVHHENGIELKIFPRNGFTERLLSRVTREGPLYEPAIIEGPHGFESDLEDFGTVLMIATGEGILSHIAQINKLLAEHRQLRTKTRDLALVWAVDTDDHYDVIKATFDMLLQEDGKINATTFRDDPAGDKAQRPGRRPSPEGECIIDVYIYRSDLEQGPEARGRRIIEIPGKPDIEQLVKDVIGTSPGKVAVIVSADATTRTVARDSVVACLNNSVMYVETEFQPAG